jgi:DNA-binding NtrC family response regulator
VTRRPSLGHQLEALQRAAESSAPILIVGAAGSGRSTLARALHLASPRGAEALVEVDVAAIPATLFESDLFGHAAGAFTGAVRARVGAVERAAGGTLLLDHVEELPLSVQPKLLRLLAEQRFAPIGGRERSAEARFLAIAADDLPARLGSGAFRQDLFYRLEVLTFRIPPLRECRGDIEPLATAILGDLRERYGCASLALAEPTWQWLREYPWPGNARQLRNVLERTLVVDPGRTVLEIAAPSAGGTAPRTLRAVEREAIRDALAYTKGHQGSAAELLGISRKALWEKRRRLGLP